MEGIQNRPLYSIGVVSELLNVHPETIRAWERYGVVRPPQRRSGKRTFSENDLKRLQFIHNLAEEGLSLRAIRYYLRLYPCWQTDDCTEFIHCSDQMNYTKPCWRESGKYCIVSSNEDLCSECRSRTYQKRHDKKKAEGDSGNRDSISPEVSSDIYSVVGRQKKTSI